MGEEREREKLRNKGNECYRRKQWAKAEGLYKRALAETQHDTKVLCNLAMCYGKMKEWSDALEFCNRAIYLESTCVKALSRRATCYVELSLLKAAAAGGGITADKIVREGKLKGLKDLDKALASDPKNDALKKQRDALHAEIKEEIVEERVKKVMVEESERAVDDEGGGDGGLLRTKAKKWIESGIEKVAKGEDFNEPPPVSEFHVIDRTLEKLDLGEIDKPMSEGGDGGDNPSAVAPLAAALLKFQNSNPTFCDVLKMSLEDSEENRVYLRANGGLERLCARLASDDEQGRAERSSLFELLAAALKGQRKSKDVAYNKMAVAAAVACVYDGGGQTVKDRVAASALLGVCLDEEGGTNPQSVKLVCSDFGMIKMLSKLIFDFAREVDVDGKGKAEGCSCSGAIPAIDLLRDLARNDVAKKVIEQNLAAASVVDAESHPVGALVYLMGRKGCGRDCRESAVCALSNLSLIAGLRRSFCLGAGAGGAGQEQQRFASAVQTLLAVARSYKTETAAARVVGLATLTNACVGENTGVREEIGKFGGVPILVALATSEKSSTVSPPVVKQRAAGLLSRCVTNPTCKEHLLNDEGLGLKLAETLVRMVLGVGWGRSGKGEEGEGEDAETADTVTHLVRCLAVVKPSPSSVPRYAKALLTLLPEPRGDSMDSMRITKTSVCMPPMEMIQGSPAALVGRDDNTVANCLKAIIEYLDGGNTKEIVKAGGVEKAVCLLANSGMFSSPAVRKNAASALARMVKADDGGEAMKRCRELRGMEILVELGRSGKV